MIAESNTSLIAIDPGSHLTGYAYFEKALVQSDKMVLAQYGLIRATRKDPFDIRCLEINAKLRNLIVKKHCTNCVIEYPQFQAGKGMHAARQGDTLILAFLCGSITVGWQLHMVLTQQQTGIFMAMPDLVKPSQWKGQLPKEITTKRCKDKYGVEHAKKQDHNITDAIMLGDFWVKENNFEVEVPTELHATREDF